MEKASVPVQREAAVAERDPFAVLRREMNSLFDELFPEPQLMRFDGFAPKVDVSENGQAVVVTAELPGIDQKDVEISLSGNRLTIAGEKKQEKEEKGEHYRLERRYGAFRRTFSLPCEIDADKASAAYEKGIVRITLPKSAAAAAATKKIPVKAA